MPIRRGTRRERHGPPHTNHDSRYQASAKVPRVVPRMVFNYLYNICGLCPYSDSQHESLISGITMDYSTHIGSYNSRTTVDTDESGSKAFHVETLINWPVLFFHVRRNRSLGFVTFIINYADSDKLLSLLLYRNSKCEFCHRQNQFGTPYSKEEVTTMCRGTFARDYC
jgi:hypothetical protein